MQDLSVHAPTAADRPAPEPERLEQRAFECDRLLSRALRHPVAKAHALRLVAEAAGAVVADALSCCVRRIEAT